MLVFMGTMSILNGNPVGHGDISPLAMLPWDISSPRHVHQALKDAHFADATCTEFQHPMHVDMPDMVKLVVGPGSQFAPLLDKMKASGRDNIHQEAVKVLNMLAGVDEVTVFLVGMYYQLVLMRVCQRQARSFACSPPSNVWRPTSSSLCVQLCSDC